MAEVNHCQSVAEHGQNNRVGQPKKGINFIFIFLLSSIICFVKEFERGDMAPFCLAYVPN